MKTALQTYFGFTSFRPNQQEIIAAVLAGRDVFAIMPTGGGKSLCYQIPAVLLPGVTVVISPLISLMKDQVDAANDNGMAAAFFNSSLSADEKRAVLARLHRRELKLLYISPERFNLPAFQNLLRSFDISLIAVDEAHCISEWGHDFRPDYLALESLTTLFPKVPLAAFTATATLKVQEDISARLKLRDPFRVRASFNRPNLSYRIVPKLNIRQQVIDYVRKHPEESGIVYMTTRKNVDAMAAALKQQGIKARPYHAGLSDTVRARNQEAFNRDRAHVIVATVAFGMGIDKSDVRYILHADLPKNMEGYYQETGRAGRDGEPAECVLFFRRSDRIKIEYFIRQTEDEDEKKRAMENLERVLRFAQAGECRRKNLLAYFDEAYPRPNCGSCDVCNDETVRTDATIEAQKLLSVIQRTGNRFGGGHVVDVLMGADTEKVRLYNHQAVKTYGAGRDRKKDYWRGLLDELEARNIIVKSPGQYSTLSLSEKAWPVLKGEEKFYSEAAAPASTRSGRTSSPVRSGPVNEELFQELRVLRRDIAERRGVPPYIVFSDKTLMEMAAHKPRTRDELMSVSGVGERKLEQYGAQFLSVIAAYSHR